MRKKPLLIIAGIVAVAIVTMLLLPYSQPVKITTLYYTDNSKDWVSNVVNYESSEQTAIDVEKMSKGDAYIDDEHQRYTINGDITSFFYNGYYNGKKFRTEYREEEFYNLSVGKNEKEMKELDKKLTKMRIAAEMNPNDGIIEGIVVARFEKNRFVFYVFVDEDWRKQLKFTNIISGNKLDEISSLQQQEFDFSSLQNGVYINKIAGNLNWYNQNPSTGGIIVGEITKEDVVNNNLSSTFIVVR